jgi:mono/diheme cytochrome c family protein
MSRLTLPFAVPVSIVVVLSLLAFGRNEPERHTDVRQHFKYGSIGAEGRTGVPYWIWLILPRLFPDLLPARPGQGYERFGLIFESPQAKRPIGTSYRETQTALVGLNCAVCHTGTLRDSPQSPRRILLGMPAHQFDLQSYQRFIFACGKDRRFTADNILKAIQEVNPQFSWFDSLVYRLLVIPRTRTGVLEQSRSFAWFDSRPPQGPGRVDTFNPYKVFFGFDMSRDASIGTADLPSLWNQKVREGMWLHWDGNNNTVTERNKSAAIGAGASEDSLDLEGMKRVEDWVWELRPPEFPHERIDAKRAEAGKGIYEKQCARCHSPGQPLGGKTIEAAVIGTDPERLNSFTAELATRMNTLGAGRPWQFSHFRKTNGYAAMPLDGVWLRAPYLHNGSVPTLRDLLKKPEERPVVFWRGYDVYDYGDVGFVHSGPDAEREGFRYDTSVRGNGRQGHAYGTDLAESEKAALLEYLKTF